MNSTHTAKSVRPTRARAKQFEDIPHYPVENLYPCRLSTGIEWMIHPVHLMSVGIIISLDGTISYAPAMVARMKINTFRVWAQCDTFSETTKFKLKLRYYDKDEKAYEQFSDVIDGNVDRFMFDIPVEHVDQQGWFACAMTVELMTPMEGEEKEAAIKLGRQEPHEPVLLRGAWLEVNG